jgi:hypothetical protein
MPEFSFILPTSTEDEPKINLLPLPAAQAMELRARWQSAQESISLRPGDLCVEKDGLGSGGEGTRDRRLYIIWCLLDPNDWLDRELVSRFLAHDLAGVDRLDCIVAKLDGPVVTVYPHQLALLRKWEET